MLTPRHLGLEVVELVFPFQVHVVEYIGNPADSAFADNYPDLRMMLQHAGKNERQQGDCHVHLETRNGRSECRALHLRFQFIEIRQTATNGVQMYRQTGFSGDIPERVPPRFVQRLHANPVGDLKTAYDAGLRHSSYLLDRSVDIVTWDTRQRCVTLRVGASE